MADTLTWSREAPEAVGLDTDQLEATWRNLAGRNTNIFLVVRRGQLVFERYSDKWSADKPHHTASLAKALVGGLSLALALDDGLLKADDLAADFIPQWRDDPQKSKITLRMLATHTAGIEDAELSAADRQAALQEGRTPTAHHMELPGWKGVFWRSTNEQYRVEGEPDPFSMARDQAPVIFEPGSAFHYSNPGIALLTYCVTVALRHTETPDVRTYLRTRLFSRLGLREGEDYSIGYGKTWDVDGLPLVASWGGGAFTGWATARIGQVLVQDGAWEGQQLIGPNIVRTTLADAGMPADIGARAGGEPVATTALGWWSNGDGSWAKVPSDAAIGAGAGDQILLVVPSLELVVVRNGGDLVEETDRRGWQGRVAHLFEPVIASLAIKAPYPLSTRITQVDWEPLSQVRRVVLGGRKKDGSDNWPLTWADDGHLYTAYGDGYGFEPQLDNKLSLGYGVVEGGPEDFVGMNIRSDGERLGPGPKGEKASGLLSIDGVIYIWVRNADGDGRSSRLGWSEDHMKTWTWADWSFAELGHTCFVNYGQDYAGARDDYVYAFANDNPSAYEQADHFVLARAPRDRLGQRDAWTFFVEAGQTNEPQWSAAIEDRGPVFTHKGQCRRSSLSFVPGLDRYLLWQQLTMAGSDTRFEGGFGLYEAPEPWGPWSTVFFTDRWDIGPGDLGHFNAKWTSDGGRTAWMVFSGSDNFCVRRVRFTVGE